MTPFTLAPDSWTLRPLALADLPGLLALTRAARWNQDEADWRQMLDAGEGWGVVSPDGTLAASTVVLPYPTPGRFAWISMVLVLPENRRQGHASRLLRTALARLAQLGLLPVLDATPDGREVYRREGFVDRWGFERWALAAPLRAGAGGDAAGGNVPGGAAFDPARRRGDGSAAAGSDGDHAGDGIAVRPLLPSDWPRVFALDARAFGADRGALLRSLAARLPSCALVAARGREIAGFVLARPGHDASQIGPLVATSDAAAIVLLDAALARAPVGRVFVDVPDRQAALRAALARHGFALQRPFTRMLHLPAEDMRNAPGDAGIVMLVAGPELG